MGKNGDNSRVVRAGAFDIDLGARELRRDGQRVALEDQPFQILGLLVQRAGKLVTRTEILEKLWPTRSPVDPDRSLDIAIHRLRQALGDTSEKADYIEILPGRGYRFVPKVVSGPPGSGFAGQQRPVPPGSFRAPRWAVGIALVALAVALVAVAVPDTVSRFREWLVPHLVLSKKIKLAVLPFKNLSGRAEDEPLSDGMTEEMITRLGQMRPERLGVIAATSVWALKHTDQSIEQIGRRLSVDYAVEGSVSHEGNRVRISARLIQVGDEKQLWGDSYDRPYDDVLSIETEVGTRVASSLALRLLPEEKARLAAPDAANSQAHDAYLNGREEWRKRTAAGLMRSIEYYNHAIAIDPNYARAYAGLADTYDALGFYSILPPSDSYGKVRVAARKALEIDDTLAEAHAALAEVLFHYDYNWNGAGEEFRRAIRLNQNFAVAHEEYSIFLALSGNEREGLTEIRRAHDLDPLSLVIGANWSLQYFYARKYNRAIEKCKETLRLEPNFALTHFWLGRAYQAAGMSPQAIAELRQASELAPENPLYLALLGHAYGASGQRAEAQQILNRLQAASRTQYVSPVVISLVYVGLDDSNQALDWAEKAFAERAPLLTRIKRDPILDSLRPEPRFQALVRRVGPPD